MKQLSTDKYQIAWFKLSEFIRRKQKERALGMYKLLMHSVEDDAFAKQVEADLLHFFEEPSAIDAYIEAAQMYQKKNKLAQATAIYEQLVLLQPKNCHFIKKLFHFYEQLNHPTRLFFSISRLIEPIIQAENCEILYSCNNIFSLIPPEEQGHLYKKAVATLIQHQPKHQLIIPFIEKTINAFKEYPKLAKTFVAHLGTINKEYQQEALAIAKKIKK
jgi:hypothetical protein